MTARKKSQLGRLQRYDLLERIDKETTDLVLEKAGEYRHQVLARDDVYDALIAAFTARLGSRALVSIPSSPEWDEYGLPMEMVYGNR